MAVLGHKGTEFTDLLPLQDLVQQHIVTVCHILKTWHKINYIWNNCMCCDRFYWYCALLNLFRSLNYPIWEKSSAKFSFFDISFFSWTIIFWCRKLVRILRTFMANVRHNSTTLFCNIAKFHLRKCIAKWTATFIAKENAAKDEVMDSVNRAGRIALSCDTWTSMPQNLLLL